ncbi:MAG: hypothetical protein KA314_13945 [Chloroflexi bacterium]|nr:hypothetical protein [Chloroflexota bacterium]MBP8056936.1 hypothetical protein [Chloroflexota bacterium]
MPQIYELFGYPLSVKTPIAEETRHTAHCPFMGGPCDGGGNRYSSQVDLTRNELLKTYFGERRVVAVGVCSIQLREDETPWVVCPRRLLILGSKKAFKRAYQMNVEAELVRILGFPSGTRLGVWSEVKLKFAETRQGLTKTFDYTFDYIVMPIASVSQSQLATFFAPWALWRKVFVQGGYTIIRHNDEDFVEDCPVGIPGIIEIMTSSTSGGNKAQRTTIAQAFEDALLARPHNAPSINKRQVWARMVSQLIVKSEVALHWGGKAVWLVQDTLADYISASTALDLRQFITTHSSEVNMLSFSYGSQQQNPTDIIELKDHQLYAGPIATGIRSEPSFQDMIRTPIKPDLQQLLKRLAESRPINEIVVP